MEKLLFIVEKNKNIYLSKTDKITEKLKNVTGRNKFEIDNFFIFIACWKNQHIPFSDSADAYFGNMRKTPQLQ